MRNGVGLVAGALLLAGCEQPSETGRTADRNAEVVAAPQYGDEIASLAAKPEIATAMDSIVAQDARNLADVIELTEIPAPPFHEEARAARFAEMLREAGLEDVRIDEVGNVIGRRAGTGEGRVVALAAHVDTVFPPETDVTVRIEGDTLHAPGVGDNSRGLVVLLSLARTMAAAGLATRDDVLFIGTVGEEGLGDLRGVKHLFREGGPRIDAFIAVDGGNAARLIHGAIGSHRYRTTFKGPGGHSWGAFGLANPHHALGRAIENFDAQAPAVTTRGPKTSYSIGRIGGGTSINSIPFESWMEVDMRSGDQVKLDEIDAVFQQAMRDALKEENDARLDGPELTVEVVQVGDRPAGLGDPNNPLVQRAMAATQAFGIQPRLASSSTDANIPISLGVPAVTISRGGVSENAHAPNESWRNKDSHVAIQLALLLVLAEAGYEGPAS